MDHEPINILLLVMGTTGSGKSTIAQVLANRLKSPFIEGDDFHSSENKAKMASGTPLQDEDRWPWLKEIRREILKKFSIPPENTAHKKGNDEDVDEMNFKKRCNFVVLACSSLKKIYRDFLIPAPGHNHAIENFGSNYHGLILYLKGSYDTILERLKERKNHFAGPALLDSQFSVLEEPSPGAENAVEISITEPLPKIYDLAYTYSLEYASTLMD